MIPRTKEGMDASWISSRVPPCLSQSDFISIGEPQCIYYKSTQLSSLTDPCVVPIQADFLSHSLSGMEHHAGLSRQVNAGQRQTKNLT